MLSARLVPSESPPLAPALREVTHRCVTSAPRARIPATEPCPLRDALLVGSATAQLALVPQEAAHLRVQCVPQGTQAHPVAAPAAALLALWPHHFQRQAMVSRAWSTIVTTMQ